MMIPRALIAEDEPVLASSLAKALRRLWPELQLAAIVEDGVAAVAESLVLEPDIVFLDINMPGKTGLDAARDLAEEWDTAKSFPLVVFVTAYDEFALEAFDHAAVDYLLKPLDDERLSRTIDRLRQRLARPPAESNDAQLLDRLRALAGPGKLNVGTLTTIRAASGNEVHLVPVEEVIYFESADKYVNVVTAGSEYLIRLTLRELLLQLSPEEFWQIHRGLVVNRKFALGTVRDELGKVMLRLKQCDRRLPVSRMFVHQFRQM